MTPRAVVRPLERAPGERCMVVSDIHGNLPLLRGLLDKVGFSQADRLIVLGDILERSEQSLDTLRFVMDLARTHRVQVVRGNCDDLLLRFLDRSVPDGFFARWLGRLGEKSVIVQMARAGGLDIRGPEDYDAARGLIARDFAPEVAFLGDTPHILVDEDYLLVHGGVPREDRLEDLDAYGCMKNDDFLGQGLAFRRWVVVGHWPVTLYRADIPSAAPIVLKDRHIVSIDGGCTLKWDGQLNGLFLPQEPGGEFPWDSCDGLPQVEALDPQEPSPDPLNVRFGHNALEVLEERGEVCRCRHLETGRALWVLTEYLYRREGEVRCEDSTDYLLPVVPGDRLSLVRQTSYGILAKKDGVTGWYLGKYEG